MLCIAASSPTYVTNYNILCERQHGFQAGKSCETQLITIIHGFANCLNEYNQTDVFSWTFPKCLTEFHTLHYVTSYHIMGLGVLFYHGPTICLQ